MQYILEAHDPADTAGALDMVDEWRQVTLGDLIEIGHGFAFQGEYFRDTPPGDILLTPGNFAIGGGFKDDKLKYYDGPVPEEFVLDEGDLIITMTDLSKGADTLGYPAIVPKPRTGRYLHNQRLGRVAICAGASITRTFLFYLLRTQSYRNEVLASATGTTVKHTSPTRLKGYSFSLPPLSEQRAIASILGALDDKIELNRRMNETLEAIARAVFTSWFVDFDPVRAKMEGQHLGGMDAETMALFPDALEESALGEIPLGWVVKPLPALINLNPPRSLSKGVTAPYLEMSNMPTHSARAIAWENRPFTSGMRFINGDVLVARITPCLENGKTAFIDFLADGQVGWGSTEYIVLHSKRPLPPEYAYFLARSDSFRTHAIQNMTGTSGRQRVPTECFNSFLMVEPPAPIASRFGGLAATTFAAMKAHDEESQTLVAIRDALLPKLLSGEIRVREVERKLEAVL